MIWQPRHHVSVACHPLYNPRETQCVVGVAYTAFFRVWSLQVYMGTTQICYHLPALQCRYHREGVRPLRLNPIRIPTALVLVSSILMWLLVTCQASTAPASQVFFAFAHLSLSLVDGSCLSISPSSHLFLLSIITTSYLVCLSTA